MKRIILMICGGLLIVTVILAGTFKYYIKPKYVAPLVMAVEEFLLEEAETVELLLQEYEEGLLEEVGLGDETEKNKGLEVDQIVESNDKEGLEIKEDSGKKPSKKTKKKDVVGGKTMAELQEEVEPGDLKAGLKIASKIDMGHLLSLAKGGLTAEKKQEAKSHLTSRLTSSEYSQLRGFVGKYAYLLK